MIVLDHAREHYDNFPTLAQIKQICDLLQRQKEPGTKHGKSGYVDIEEEAPKFPWPNSILGLLLNFEDEQGRGLSNSGMSLLGISADEAKYLYDAWKAQDWKNEWALEIISKSKSDSALRAFTAGDTT
jgi:hypothetical protein